MSTKPAAQEPCGALMGFQERDGELVQARCVLKRRHKGPCEPGCEVRPYSVPTTPTPSQPAGAREWRFSHPDRPDDIDEMLEAYATYRLAKQTAALRAAILDIDAHATPLGHDADGFVTGGYQISVGALHRALGLIGHSSAKCKDVPCDRAEAAERERDSLREWTPIEQAPRTGEHILVTALGKGGFGTCGGDVQDLCAVVHWWDHPGEEGWYLSLGNDDNAQLWPTHFKRLAALKAGKDREK